MGMSTEKVSLTLDDELVEQARQHAGQRGLSGYVNRALRRQLQRDRLITFLEEADQAAGPVDDSVMDEVRREWPAAAPPRRRRSA
jgi:Arc/MetJ family transcription regulator